MVKRILTVLALLVTGIAATASTAQADPVGRSGVLACHYVSNTGTGPAYGGGESDLSGEAYMYSVIRIVPGSSSCNDIQLPVRYSGGPHPSPLNAQFRVRFFPTTGGNYANSWKSNNINTSANLIIATAVNNGTYYRVESRRVLANGTVVTEPHNFDLMD